MENKRENYSDTFENCARWLEENRYIRGCVQWMQKHVKLALVIIFVLASVLYIWLAYSQKASIFRELAFEDSALQIHDLNQSVKKMQREIQGLERKLLQAEKRLDKRDDSLGIQVDTLKQVASLGKIPLAQMVVNDKKVSLSDTKIFWVKKRTLKLTRLSFGEGWKKPLTAARDINCIFSINHGPKQRISGIGDALIISLPATEETRFTLLLSKITFSDVSQKKYSGFAAFTVNIDVWKPQVSAELKGDSIELTVEDRGGEFVGNSLILIAQKDGITKWRVTPADPAPFTWQKSEQKHFLKLPVKVLGKWKRVSFTACDLAGNQGHASIRNLPRPAIDLSNGSSLSLPVMLDVIASAPAYQAFLYLEKFEEGEFHFLRKCAVGAISLQEGLYRVRAFFKIDGEQGPYGSPVEFCIDNTPPHAEIELYLRENRLHWQIAPNEKKVQAWASVEWQGRFLALNVLGLSGNCELPNLAHKVTVQVKLQDEAGNESVLTRDWERK